MKKILAILAICGLATTAPAASFLWQVSGVSFDGATLKSDTSLTAYLVYLGNGGSLASSYDAKAIGDLASSAVDSVTGTTAKGAASKTYALSAPASGDFTELNGDTYGLLLSYVSGGKTYYNLSSATYEVTGVANATSTLSQYKPAAATFAYGTKSAGSSVSAGSGWVAVPEPSTAALALAGLALLIKRRRA